ncbi:MAG: STAS domain-containing protein [Phycisphaerae bacterium]
MNINVDRRGSYSLATLEGELRADDALKIADTLHPLVAPQGARVAVDLSKLSQINSAGLSELIDVVARARLSGSRVVLISPSTFVQQVFDVTRLDQWFDIVDDHEAAAAALEG